MQLGKLDEAEKYFIDSIEIFNKDRSFNYYFDENQNLFNYYFLGAIYSKKNNKAKAIEMYTKISRMKAAYTGRGFVSYTKNGSIIGVYYKLIDIDNILKS